MREVEVTATLDAPRAEVERALTPESIVEYAGTYEIESVEKRAGKTVMEATGEDIGITLEFTEREDGYGYVQLGDEGPFEEMRTRITVEGSEEARVTVRSEFTFGGWTAFLTDWLGADIRRDELQRLVANLARDLVDESDESDE